MMGLQTHVLHSWAHPSHVHGRILNLTRGFAKENKFDETSSELCPVQCKKIMVISAEDCLSVDAALLDEFRRRMAEQRYTFLLHTYTYGDLLRGGGPKRMSNYAEDDNGTFSINCDHPPHSLSYVIGYIGAIDIARDGFSILLGEFTADVADVAHHVCGPINQRPSTDSRCHG